MHIMELQLAPINGASIYYLDIINVKSIQNGASLFTDTVKALVKALSYITSM